MSIFGHEHRWDCIDSELGPWVDHSPTYSSAPRAWFHVCEDERCNAFMVSLSGADGARITGRLPKDVQHGSIAATVAYLRRYLPEAMRAPGEPVDMADYGLYEPSLTPEA